MAGSKEDNNLYVNWNPWHGCTKYSSGCKYCYVYRQDEMYGNPVASSTCRKNSSFNLPVQRKRDGTYKIPSGKIVFTCFTSDFLLSDADEWRKECWNMIRERKDLLFYFFTKRIERFADCIPPDWDDGYSNVLIGCTVENQKIADFRLPIFKKLPIKHKSIIVAPMLERMDIEQYLDESIEEVSASGESGKLARECNFDWIINLREQCVRKDVPFVFHQTGAHFIKNGKLYNIPRKYQISQAKKAQLDYRIMEYQIPETYNLDENIQLTF